MKHIETDKASNKELPLAKLVAYDSRGIVISASGSNHQIDALLLRHAASYKGSHFGSQRNFQVCEIPTDTTIEHCVQEDCRLTINFSDLKAAIEFDISKLLDVTGRGDDSVDADNFDRRLWTATTISGNAPHDWELIKRNEGAKARCIKDCIELGFAILNNVPQQPNALEDVVRKFGRIKENRAGRIYDVVVQPSASNLAFTDGALALHTDNPYRNPVPGFQFLHCIRSASVGGRTVLADGFAVADYLRRSRPTDFDILRNTLVRFKFRAEEADFESTHPLIECAQNGRLMQIRTNNGSMGLPVVGPTKSKSFYDAYKLWIESLASDKFAINFLLHPGEVLIADNHRVLHGRTSFGQDPSRFLQGCYCDRDWLESGYRSLLNAGVNHAS